MIKVMVTKTFSVMVKILKRILLRRAGTTYCFCIISQYGYDTGIVLEILKYIAIF